MIDLDDTLAVHPFTFLNDVFDTLDAQATEDPTVGLTASQIAKRIVEFHGIADGSISRFDVERGIERLIEVEGVHIATEDCGSPNPRYRLEL